MIYNYLYIHSTNNNLQIHSSFLAHKGTVAWQESPIKAILFSNHDSDRTKPSGDKGL